MRLFTNINRDDGDNFVCNLKEMKENYRAEKSYCEKGEYPYNSFEEYCKDWIELNNALQGEFLTNVRNHVCRVTVRIDNKRSRNLIDYDTEIIR